MSIGRGPRPLPSLTWRMLPPGSASTRQLPEKRGLKNQNVAIHELGRVKNDRKPIEARVSKPKGKARHVARARRIAKARCKTRVKHAWRIRKTRHAVSRVRSAVRAKDPAEVTNNLRPGTSGAPARQHHAPRKIRVMQS